jgi:beta-lactamase class A
MSGQWWSAVEAIAAAAEARGAIVGVSIVAPDGERWSRYGDRRFHAASTVKTGVMVEVYRQIERGNLTLRDLVTLDDADKVGGTGVLSGLHDGLPLSVADLLYLMMAISDNTATNLLVDLAGLDATNATTAELGMSAASAMHRKMLGRLPQGDEPENWATPDDHAALMHAIVADRAASPDSCAAMRALLAKQQCTTRFKRLLPVEGITWGSKIGALPEVCNDVGYVTGPGGTIVLALFVEGLPELEAEPVIGEIVRAAAIATGVFPA